MIGREFVLQPSMNYRCEGICVFSGAQYSTAEFGAEELAKYLEGKTLIQNVFPNLSAGDREFIMSGICPEAFEQFRTGGPAKGSRRKASSSHR